MADLAILIPVLNRPHRIRPTAESIAENTTVDYRIMWLATKGEVAVHEAILEIFDESFMQIALANRRSRGDYAFKINAALVAVPEPFLFMAADDLKFHPGWDVAALTEFGDPKIGVVGTQDLGNSRVIRGEHSTHSMVRTSYIDEFGTIDTPGKALCELYPHEFVDDEFIETAKSRGAFKFCNESIVEHMHPLWGKAPTDKTYRAQTHRMRTGRAIYNRRKHRWT